MIYGHMIDPEDIRGSLLKLTTEDVPEDYKFTRADFDDPAWAYLLQVVPEQLLAEMGLKPDPDLPQAAAPS